MLIWGWGQQGQGVMSSAADMALEGFIYHGIPFMLRLEVGLLFSAHCVTVASLV